MFLVTGASGQLGQRVLHHLVNTLNVEPQQIIAASRNPEKLEKWASIGVTTRPLDFENKETFTDTLEGVTRALLISTDALDRPGRRLNQHKTAIEAFVKAGIKHVVYTSMPKPSNSPLLIAPDHEGTEQLLADSSLQSWTILRNHWYFENNYLFLPSALATGNWYTADEGKGSADISRDDLARAAATVLASNDTDKKIYTLSGSQALTKDDIANQVSAAINKPLTVIQIPLESLVQGMIGAGLPEPIARVYASFDTNTAAGRVAEISGDYQKITGMKPQSFSDWIRENKEQLSKL